MVAVLGSTAHLCCCMAMAGILRFSSPIRSCSQRGELRSSLAGGLQLLRLREACSCALRYSGSWCPRHCPLARSRVSAIPEVLKTVEWPEQFPFKQEDFQRYDETSDTLFYVNPRFVTHIDDPAIKALSQYYESVFPISNTPDVALLDLCSSWISHYPKNYQQERIVGLGLNEEELKRNGILTEYVVKDLNVDPSLPFEENAFDVITNAVSVDYLIKPLETFKGDESCP